MLRRLVRPTIYLGVGRRSAAARSLCVRGPVPDDASVAAVPPCLCCSSSSVPKPAGAMTAMFKQQCSGMRKSVAVGIGLNDACMGLQVRWQERRHPTARRPLINAPNINQAFKTPKLCSQQQTAVDFEWWRQMTVQSIPAVVRFVLETPSLGRTLAGALVVAETYAAGQPMRQGEHKAASGSLGSHGLQAYHSRGREARRGTGGGKGRHRKKEREKDVTP
eukprot:355279-Chlamydomonas_euryale.AAC.3